MRSLTSKEMEFVGGGLEKPADAVAHLNYFEGQWNVEFWSADGSQFYGLVDAGDYSGSVVVDSPVDNFACVGFADGVAGGFCYANGNVYGYGGLGGSGTGSVTGEYGTSSNTDALLTGPSVAYHLPTGPVQVGGGETVSFNNDGSIAATGDSIGSSGATLTYGVNLTQLWTDFANWATNAGQQVSQGLYNQFGQPYTPPSEQTGMQQQATLSQ